MGHGHGHDHSHATDGVSDRGLLWAVVLNLGLSVFEFAAGLVSGSTALMADALHNTNDAAALLIAWLARLIARKGADHHYTFGYRRAELIGAMIQLTALILVGLYLVVEGVRRFFQPEPVLGQWMMIASAVALVVDLFTVWLLWAMSKGSLNVRAAFLHNLTDAGSSIAVLAGGAAVTWLGWLWIDPVLTLIIAGYILFMSAGMMRRTSRILMEGAPLDLDLNALNRSAQEVDGVEEILHVHAWELDEHHVALEAHVVIGDEAVSRLDAIRRELKTLLKDQFEIGHSTLEFETKADACVEADSQLVTRH